MHQITEAPTSAIEPSKTNPRKTMREAELAELAESVRLHGILQPILVRRIKWTFHNPTTAFGWLIRRNDVEFQEWKNRERDANKAKDRWAEVQKLEFEIVCGERRWRAALVAKLKSIPVIIRELTDAQALEIQLVENLQRQDLAPLEEANGFRALVDTCKFHVDEIATKTGFSKSYVYGRLKLLDLIDQAKKALAKGALSESNALLIARIPNPAYQLEALNQIVDGDFQMPHRDAAEYVARHFTLRLNDAPFSLKDPSLTNAGACVTCPKRTGAQPELFADIKSADVCTDPTCYAAKRDAHNKRSLAKAEAAGQAILDEKTTKQVFTPHGDLKSGAGYIDLKAICYSDHKARPWSTVLGKNAPAPVLAVDPAGNPHQLIDSTAALAAAKKIGLKIESWELPAARDPEADAADRKKEKERLAKEQAGQDAYAADLVAKVEAIAIEPKGFWHAIADLVCSSYASGHGVLNAIRRRAWQDSTRNHFDIITENLKRLSPQQARGLAIEILHDPDQDNPLDAVLKLDRKAIEKAAAAAWSAKPNGAETVINEVLEWLIHCPAGDPNFKEALKNANAPTLQVALTEDLSKAARAAIIARLKKASKSK